MPLDPTLPTTTTSAASASASATSSRPTPQLPQPILHYPSPQPHQQQQQPLLPPQQQQQTLPIRSPNPHLTKHSNYDPSSPFPFQFPSPGRGPVVGGGSGSGSFPLKGGNPTAGYPPHSIAYSHGVRVVPSPHVDYLHPALHLPRPLPHLQHPHPGHSPVAAAAVKGGAVSAHPKKPSREQALANLHFRGAPPLEAFLVIIGTPRSAASDSKNGYKDASKRERSSDDTFCVVRDRRVKITEDASLYAICRSWLRNGVNEDIKPQQKDVMNALPKPLSASEVASIMPNEKEDEKDEDEQEEDGKSVEHLSPKDLLMRHVKRAKRVRARLREERSKRIERYKHRLALLLPPPAEK
ncbi:hypothetical protein RIF29_38303 [Crotalaria pallida]|uniref:Uncharacterized protein n=1 Tax=Crotalaria pallida TaxID=3830 RepID=A0AAN9DZF3_CROPI